MALAWVGKWVEHWVGERAYSKGSHSVARSVVQWVEYSAPRWAEQLAALLGDPTVGLLASTSVDRLAEH